VQTLSPSRSALHLNRAGFRSGALKILALGNYDEAFVWFERAYQEREGILQWLRVHPFFDPVREDPRFKTWSAGSALTRWQQSFLDWTPRQRLQGLSWREG